MVDALNLNPARVKRMLVEKGYTVHGRFSDKKCRDDKEQVSYEHFYQELINSCCGANRLAYIGKVSLKDLYDTGFSFKEVIIPKGNYCGIFSSTYGGGSLLQPARNGTEAGCPIEPGGQRMPWFPFPA